MSERKIMIDKGHTKLSISKQCTLLQINRSSLYYKPQSSSELNLTLMRKMDEHYLEHPYKGARRMHIWLTKDLGYEVSTNRVENLYYRKMSLRSILPGPHTSKRNKNHKTYPYLLRDLSITRPNQVWATDITYIPMAKGFMYLIAVIDLYSRYVVHWSVSNSMEAEWCSSFIEEAFQKHGIPDILNTDQGAQFTSDVFTTAVLSADVKLSMDGKGRATDNAFDDGNGRIARALSDLLLALSDDSSQRFYSLSSQILAERKVYYEILKKVQHSNGDITNWLAWFLNCLYRALKTSEETMQKVLYKSEFWDTHKDTIINSRQRLMLNKLLDGFDGKLKSSKWAKITKCSTDTALRDMKDLIEKGILKQDKSGGRSTNYELIEL